MGLVSEFARLLKECGVGCLNGRQALFEEMKARRHAAMEAWRQEERANRIRNHAHVAWHKKDYAAVAKLYESIVDALDEVEKKRLDYAKRKML